MSLERRVIEEVAARETERLFGPDNESAETNDEGVEVDSTIFLTDVLSALISALDKQGLVHERLVLRRKDVPDTVATTLGYLARANVASLDYLRGDTDRRLIAVRAGTDRLGQFSRTLED